MRAHSFRTLALLSAIVLAAVLSPSTSAAQGPSASVDGPRNAAVGVTNVVAMAESPSLPALPQDQTTERSHVILMVVGGAAIVVGSVVGGDGGQLIMIGGAVVGLIGLWRWLQHQ